MTSLLSDAAVETCCCIITTPNHYAYLCFTQFMSDSHIDKIHINKIHSCNNDPKYRQVRINSRVSVKGSLGVIYSQKSPLNVQI